jgi:hypothetical protein
MKHKAGTTQKLGYLYKPGFSGSLTISHSYPRHINFPSLLSTDTLTTGYNIQTTTHQHQSSLFNSALSFQI